MLIPENVVQQLKALDHDMEIYNSPQGWIDHLVRLINEGRHSSAKQVYDIVVDHAFTSYSSILGICRTQAVQVVGHWGERQSLLLSRVKTSVEFTRFTLMAANYSPQDKALYPKLYGLFQSLNPTPTDWLKGLAEEEPSRAHDDISDTHEFTIATYWSHTTASSVDWYLAIRQLERKFEHHPARAQLLTNIAIERQREAIKREDPFKSIAQT